MSRSPSSRHSQRYLRCLRAADLPACLHISFAHPDRLSLCAKVWLRVTRRETSSASGVRSDSSTTFLGVSRRLSGTGGVSSGSVGFLSVGSYTTALSLDVADKEGLGFSTSAPECCDEALLSTMEAGVCLRLEADYASCSLCCSCIGGCCES